MMAVEVDSIVTGDDLSGLKDFDLVAVAKQSPLLELLNLLVQHDNPFVRAALCDNPHLSPDLVKILRKDTNDHVKLRAEKLQAPDLTEVLKATQAKRTDILGKK